MATFSHKTFETSVKTKHNKNTKTTKIKGWALKFLLAQFFNLVGASTPLKRILLPFFLRGKQISRSRRFEKQQSHLP